MPPLARLRRACHPDGMTQPATCDTGRFFKVSGLDNDFVVLPCFDAAPHDPPELARRLCDRRHGIGADGLILATRPTRPEAHLRMIIYNPDGSRPGLCGNGLRCLAMLAWRRGWCRRRTLAIETDTTVHTAELTLCSGRVRTVRVAMGRVVWDPHAVGIRTASGPWIDHPLHVADHPLRVTCASLGNPHAIIFTDDPDTLDLHTLGPAIEHHPVFTAGTNVHFVRILGPHLAYVRTWERACGPTAACASGACAIVAAAVRTGRLAPRAAVRSRGGVVYVGYEPATESVWQSGPARIDFEGTLPADGSASPAEAPAS